MSTPKKRTAKEQADLKAAVERLKRVLSAIKKKYGYADAEKKERLH